MKVKIFLTHALHIYICIEQVRKKKKKVNEIRLDYYVGTVRLLFRCYFFFFASIYTYVDSHVYL
jgi:hypothetical protein